VSGDASDNGVTWCGPREARIHRQMRMGGKVGRGGDRPVARECEEERRTEKENDGDGEPTSHERSVTVVFHDRVVQGTAGWTSPPRWWDSPRSTRDRPASRHRRMAEHLRLHTLSPSPTLTTPGTHLVRQASHPGLALGLPSHASCASASSADPVQRTPDSRQCRALHSAIRR
jgi:hypothetical protein